MEWDPDESDGWVADAERWVCEIQGVRDCKIDVGSGGDITGVHVVSGVERETRQVSRDVENLLKARLGMDVPQERIGVVQIVDNRGGMVEDTGGPDDSRAETGRQGRTEMGAVPAVLLEEPPAPRIQCGGVGVLASEQTLRAEVTLNLGAVETRGVEEGPNHTGGDLQLIGRATITAVRQLLDEPLLLSLAEIRLLDVGGEQLVLAAVELVEGRRSERLFGTCPAQHNRQQAVVFAVLDALNRRLLLMNFKSTEAGN